MKNVILLLSLIPLLVSCKIANRPDGDRSIYRPPTQRISVTNLDFLNDWKKISNAGTQNCGIYIKAERLIKCNGYVSAKQEEMFSKLAESYPKDLIFPWVYTVYEYSDISKKKTNYVEMDRFDGDVSDLLFKILPRVVAKNTSALTDNQKEVLIDIFYQKLGFGDLSEDETIEKLIFGKNSIYINPLGLKLYELKKKNLTEYEKLLNSLPKDKNGRDAYGGKSPYNGIDYELYSENYKKDVEKLEKLTAYKISHLEKITFAQYEAFLGEIKKEFKKIWPGLKKQIIWLKLLLARSGLKYDDNKIDNFAYKLESQKRKHHLGVDWNDNQINGEFFYLSIIDWDSGLFEIDDPAQNKKWILENYNTHIKAFMRMGSYPNSIAEKKFWFRGIDSDKEKESLQSLGLNEDVQKILNLKDEVELPVDTNFATLQDVAKDILNGNVEVTEYDFSGL